MYRTKDQVAEEFIAEGRRRGITPRGIVICIATGLVESGLVVYANSKVPESMDLPHDAVGSDGKSVGPLQQQVMWGNGWWWGDAATCMDPTKSAGLFYDRLAKLDYNNATRSPGKFAQDIQRSAFPDRYDQRMGDAVNIYARLTVGGAPLPENRPDFNEYEMWSPNSSDRGGTKVDLFLLHTQEGDGNADSLARYLQGHEVSYHYTVSEDYKDHGVTVVDVVDTDQASWSVLSANPRSINLCFAGSKASWTRQQWLQQSKAIDAAAYLAAQDCKKYGINPRVLAPPYNSNPPGISDHRYVTQWLKDGTHTDVGLGFPWDVFEAAVKKYTGPSPTPAPPVGPAPVNPANDQLTLRWQQLGGQTLVEAVAEIRDKLLGTNDHGKPGVK
jgi:N-acetyl-anhydromuramyl-L-alanine amidase AmpD